MISYRRTLPIDPSNYRALANFFRGYLHQDVISEYGNLTAAAQTFRRDADEREIAIVRSQLDRLLSETSNGQLSDLLALVSSLGSSWLFKTREEIEQLRDVLK